MTDTTFFFFVAISLFIFLETAKNLHYVLYLRVESRPCLPFPHIHGFLASAVLPVGALQTLNRPEPPLAPFIFFLK